MTCLTSPVSWRIYVKRRLRLLSYILEKAVDMYMICDSKRFSTLPRPRKNFIFISLSAKSHSILSVCKFTLSRTIVRHVITIGKVANLVQKLNARLEMNGTNRPAVDTPGFPTLDRKINRVASSLLVDTSVRIVETIPRGRIFAEGIVPRLRNRGTIAPKLASNLRSF